jgi:hypothetical protein
MRRPTFSLLTSAGLFVGAVIWLMLANGAGAFFWIVFSLIWLFVALYQWLRHDTAVVDHPRTTFQRRFLRFFMFLS